VLQITIILIRSQRATCLFKTFIWLWIINF